MANQEAKKGKLIAERIRKTLLQIDLKLVEADALMKINDHDYQLNKRINTQKNQQKALEAKAIRECYKVYIENLGSIKKQVLDNLERVLDKYNSKYKQIWILYFIEHRPLEYISSQVHYTEDNVKKVVARLKSDLVIEEMLNEEKKRN